MCQCGGGRKGYYSWFPPGDFPVEDGGGPVKRIQTPFISQNYVSPLWHCTKSKWKSLICCIDSHSSVPPFHTYGACSSLTQRYATLGPCHMAYCVAYSNFSAVWKLTMTNEEARGKMYHLLTMERREYIFLGKQQAMYCVKRIFMKLRSTLVCLLWAWICSSRKDHNCTSFLKHYFMYTTVLESDR